MPDFGPITEQEDPSPKPKNKGGRPKGTKNNNYLTLRYWFTQMQKDMVLLKPYQRAIVAQKMMQCLMSHDRHLRKDKTETDEAVDMNEVDLIASLDPTIVRKP